MGFGFLLSLEVKRHNGVAILAALKDFSEDLLAFLCFLLFFSHLWRVMERRRRGIGNLRNQYFTSMYSMVFVFDSLFF